MTSDFEELVKARDEIRRLEAELEKVKSESWAEVELKEGVGVVFVGVHALSWSCTWGKPSVGFVRYSEKDD